MADPQIVDPHTYPDRPWPLSSLTILYTDLYLKRSYRHLLRLLQPDSTLFLGDLFDGGREWGSISYASPEDRYRQYGQDFWVREYKRFQRMFIDGWYDAGIARLPSAGGRQLIVSLPGNHDLGFAGGIDEQVKSRFDAHFGPLNRIDVLGNHTFVSLDTVSLSAMDQVDPQTGSHGAGDGSAAATTSTKIWKPVEDYLREAPQIRERAVKHRVQWLGAQSGRTKPMLKSPMTIESPNDETGKSLPATPNNLRVRTSQFPTIVLSHVPLYRGESSHCGPFRERGTAIPISAGYQYQNVLTPLISKDVVEHLGASQIAMIYSGDDHDYCEIEHDEFTGRIKEVTVKSMSWAMGIRKPGVQLVSLWNPINLDTAIIPPEAPTADIDSSKSSPEKPETILNMPKNTVQNHLCLLPDQLSIFIRYAQLLGATIVILFIRAILYKSTEQSTSHSPDLEKHQTLLPLNRTHTSSFNDSKLASSPPLRPQQNTSISSTSSTSTTEHASNRLNTTSRKVQSQYVGGYGNLPASSRSASPALPSSIPGTWQADSDDWGNPTTEHDRTVYAKANRPIHRDRRWYHWSSWWLFRASPSRTQEFLKSVCIVAGPTVSFYLWMLFSDM